MKHTLLTTLLLSAFCLAPIGYANDNIAPVPENLFTVPLESYQMDAKDTDQRIYVKPGLDLTIYHKVLLESPLFLRQDQNKEWELLQPSEESKIANYFKSRMAAELAKQGIELTEEAGPDVLRLRFAVTGVAPTRPGLDLIDVLPAKAAINIAKLAIDKEPYLLRIGTMAQIEDSVSGELLAGTVNLKETSKSKIKDKPVTLAYLEKEVDKLSKKSAAQLAKAMKPN